VRTRADTLQALQKLLASPDLASKRWIWEQYDHLVTGQTVQRPGGDAAVVRIPGKKKALALVTDCTPRYCAADPKRGGAQAVAETWRNLTAVGATPIAITDNMNFGNPERPEIMGQFVLCIEGMREACLALDYPVVSGNVSLYNETNGSAILPTPVIGGVGLIDDATKSVSLAFKGAGEAILLIGETNGHLGSSLYLREIAGSEEGAPPPVDLVAERRNGDAVRAAIRAGEVTACHDISDGGLLVALAEMAIAGGIGATVTAPGGIAHEHAFWFGEDQARYILTTGEPEKLIARMKAASVPVLRLGTTGRDALSLSDGKSIAVAALRRVNEAWLPAYMAGD
jgi:phosphoribosylformylglycinamidine synthase subunit PurL